MTYDLMEAQTSGLRGHSHASIPKGPCRSILGNLGGERVGVSWLRM